MEWCNETEEVVSTHKLRRLSADPAKHAQVVDTLAEAVPDYYADPGRIAQLLKKLGKDAAANYIEQKLPTQVTIRSGDLGEILCTAYVHEATPFNLGIKRLRWKDHRNMSMRGEDVLAFRLSGKSGSLKNTQGRGQERGHHVEHHHREGQGSAFGQQRIAVPPRDFVCCGPIERSRRYRSWRCFG
jgi:hypothetical protein